MGTIILLPRLTTPWLIVTPVITFLYFYSQVVPYTAVAAYREYFSLILHTIPRKIM